MNNLRGERAILDLIAESSRNQVRHTYAASWEAGYAPISDANWQDMFLQLRQAVGGENSSKISIALIKVKESLESIENLGIDLYYSLGASAWLESAEMGNAFPSYAIDEQIMNDNPEYFIYSGTVAESVQKIISNNPELDPKLRTWIEYHQAMCRHYWKIAILHGMKFAAAVHGKTDTDAMSLLQKMEIELGIQQAIKVS